MAPCHYSYLFDSEAFQQQVKPYIPDWDTGNYASLRAMGHQAALQSPPTRDFLDSDYLSGVYDQPMLSEDAEASSPSDYLTALLLPFLSPVPVNTTIARNGWFAYHGLRENWQWVGWEQHDTELFLFGRSLCELLFPDRPFHLMDKRRSERWCNPGFGWLDSQNVALLSRKVTLVMSKLNKFRLGPSLLTAQQHKVLVKQSHIFAHVDQVVAEASSAEKALLVTVSS